MLFKYYDEFYFLLFKIERKFVNKLIYLSCLIFKGLFGEVKNFLEIQIYTGGYYLVGRVNMDILFCLWKYGM